MTTMIQKAFAKFAEDLSVEITSGKLSKDDVHEWLLGFGYKVTDSGCWYNTYTMKSSRKGYYIHLWWTNVGNDVKDPKFLFAGMAWGDKDSEYGRI